MSLDFRHIILALAAALLAACSDSHDAPVYGGDIMLSPSMEGALVWTGSRDASTDPIPGTVPETIGVFAEIKSSNSEIFRNQCMFNPAGKEVLDDPAIDLEDWEPGVWPYHPTKTWIADKDYYFYCYAPYKSDAFAEWKPGISYYTFYMKRIPPISATEYAVGKYYVTGSSATGRPHLTLTHITSRLRFLFAIGKQFSKLRNIRVTSIRVSDSGNGTPYWECEVPLDKPLPKPDPSDPSDPSDLSDYELSVTVKKSTEIYVSTSDIELIAENVSTDPKRPGQLLTLDYVSFSSAYNLLGKINSTKLTVVYDVYDTADQLLRKDQTVTNTIDLSSFGSLERGKCYDVRILVCPKYLYVLSDNDVAPTAVIEPNP